MRTPKPRWFSRPADLKRLIVLKGVDLDEFQEKTGISPRRIQQLCRAAEAMRPATCRKIAEGLGVEMTAFADLLDDEPAEVAS